MTHGLEGATGRPVMSATARHPANSALSLQTMTELRRVRSCRDDRHDETTARLDASYRYHRPMVSRKRQSDHLAYTRVVSSLVGRGGVPSSLGRPFRRTDASPPSVATNAPPSAQRPRPHRQGFTPPLRSAHLQVDCAAATAPTTRYHPAATPTTVALLATAGVTSCRIGDPSTST